MNIAIVEDEDLVALHIQTVLAANGFKNYGVFNNGEDAIAAFKEKEPDMILMDIVLGNGINGIETAGKIREFSGAPIIYLTATHEDEIIENAKKTLPAAFLKKPINENQLKSSIKISYHRHLEIQRAMEELRKKNDFNELNISELSETNAHLIAATWRERDIKKKLADTIEELNKTKILLETQNKRVAESINYSRKIQLAINTTEADIKKRFVDGFIFYKPKDVISGDFPWMQTNESEDTFLAAVDCTGHGVPGAMLSMIGNLLLNEIITVNKNFTPAQVLLELHNQIVYTLKQDLPESNSNDGMDIAMCQFNKERTKLLYSGAHRPLLLLRNNELEYFTGDKFPVGGVQYRGKNTYSNIELELQKGDRIYIFSDGIVDQIGGKEGKKWMINGLKEFIIEMNKLPFQELKEELENRFYMYKKDYKQIDDLLVIGVEI